MKIPEPRNLRADDITNLPEKLSSGPTASVTEQVGGNLMNQKKGSTLTRQKLEEFNTSPYYKGLLYTNKAETESNTHHLRNSKLPSPYYKGLLYLSPAPTNRRRESRVAKPTTKRSVENEKDKGELKEYTWADKYRPVALKDFICNKDIASELQKMVNEDELQHFIFEGQAGVGKRTMVWALLREAFGPDGVQARDECKRFNLKGEEVSSIIVNVKESCQHIEINLSELKGFEKHVIVELIIEANKLTNNMERCGNENCRVIILHEADKLSTDDLLYIRLVLEQYRGCHKIFFCCQDASKLHPLMNFCKLVQVLSPSNKEIVEVLEYIATEENIELPKKLAERIAINSNKNLRQAIRSFEATWQYNSQLEDDQVLLTGWEDDIADIAKNIVENPSHKQLYDIHRKLQNLISHSVPPEFIFDTLLAELKKNVEESMHNQIERTAKEYGFFRDYERYGNDGRKRLILQFMSIEEFIAKFMSLYRSHLAKMAQDMTASEGEPL